MKFLCEQCGAKYQIADDRISGRTLRMKCRRCDHDIVVRGDKKSSLPPPEPTVRASISSRPASSRSGSTLGSEFHRQLASGPVTSQAAPPPTEIGDMWHVAIKDVPVGPIRMTELARKIAVGAVDGNSLVWREGFDDWRPLEEVAELVQLLKRSAPPPLPSLGARPPIPRQPPPPRTRARGASSNAIPRTVSEANRPAARSNVVPIGGRLGAMAAPTVEEVTEGYTEDLPGEPTSVAAAPPGLLESLAAGTARPSMRPEAFGAAEPVVAPGAKFADTSETKKRRAAALPVGAWMGIAGAVAFGGMLAILIFTESKKPKEGAEEKVAAVTTQTKVPEVPAAPSREPALEAEPSLEAEKENAEEAEGKKKGGKIWGAKTDKTSTKSTGPALSSAEKALLDRFSDESAQGSIDIRVNKTSEGGEGAAARGNGNSLTREQLTEVVSRNRPALGRCYESAIRGVRSPPSVRMDVEITVGMSGTVTKVSASGQDFGNLSACIEQSVRRWRFPSAGDSSETRFPVVFAPQS